MPNNLLEILEKNSFNLGKNQTQSQIDEFLEKFHMEGGENMPKFVKLIIDKKNLAKLQREADKRFAMIMLVNESILTMGKREIKYEWQNIKDDNRSTARN